MTELTIQRDLEPTVLEPIGDGYTVYGRAVPYGVDNRVTDDGREFYLERFAAASFERDVSRGARWVNLMVGHRGDDGERYLGRCLAAHEERDGLYLEFRLDRSNPLADAARSGELTKWSVSARVYRTREENHAGQLVRVREVCGLSHVAATASPQYRGAGVLVARDHVVIPPTEAPRREEFRKKLDMLRNSR